MRFLFVRISATDFVLDFITSNLSDSIGLKLTSRSRSRESRCPSEARLLLCLYTLYYFPRYIYFMDFRIINFKMIPKSNTTTTNAPQTKIFVYQGADCIA